MRILVISSCTKSKRTTPCCARDLYTGRQHQLILQGVDSARAQGLDITLKVVSAGYGVVGEADMLAPYDQSFNGIPPSAVAHAGSILGIPGAMRDLLSDDSYDVAFVALGRNYLMACNLGSLETLAFPTFFIGGIGGLLPNHPLALVVPAGHDAVGFFGGGLVGVKGAMVSHALGSPVLEHRVLRCRQATSPWSHCHDLDNLARRWRPLLTSFSSGLAHTSDDLMGVWRSGAPIGIIAAAVAGNRVSYRPWSSTVMAYVASGRPVFCDSGAFTTFGTGLVIDFEVVMGRYREIVDQAPRAEAVTLVMPDCVGDQGKTIALWDHYRLPIRSMVASGADVLMPLQSGAYPLPSMYRLAQEATGCDNPGVAIPMVHGATPIDDLLAFVASCQPQRLHLLGMGMKRVTVDLCQQMTTLAPGIIITSDAMEMKTSYGARHQYVSPGGRRLRALDTAGDGRMRKEHRRTLTPEEEAAYYLPEPESTVDADRLNDQMTEALADVDWDALGEHERQCIADLAGGNFDLARELACIYPHVARSIALILDLYQPVDRVGFVALHVAERRSQVPVPKVPWVFRQTRVAPTLIPVSSEWADHRPAGPVQLSLFGPGALLAV